MQHRGDGIRPGGGFGSTAADRPWAFRSFSARAGRKMSIVDDIRVRVLCQSALPERTGPHTVGTARLKLQTTGQGRKRFIAVQLWYPAEGEREPLHARGLNWLAKLLHPTWAPAHRGAPLTPAKATYPLITYVPDAHGRHDDNTFALANLASHGFVLAAIDDPYRNGKVTTGASAANAHESLDVGTDSIATRAGCVARGVATASALLDALQALEPDSPGRAWAGRLDLRQVGILGYAMGGSVASEVARVDRRYGVVANLDGPLRREGELVGVPYLLMLSDPSMLEPYSAPLQGANALSPGDYRRAHDQAALPESHVMEVAGTKREHFSDRLIFPSRLLAGCQPSANSKRIRAIIDSYAVAFFTTYLDGGPHPLMCVRHSPYPEVHFLAGSGEHGAWALRDPAGRA